MRSSEFCEALAASGITTRRAAQLFAVHQRAVRRWRDGTRPIPRGVDIVIRLLAMGATTVDAVERAAVRTNGSAKPEAPAPVAPAPEQLVVAGVKTAARSTAEKVFELVPDRCKWPIGDPAHSDFRFCNAVISQRPYCEIHRRVAYVQIAPARRSSLHRPDATGPAASPSRLGKDALGPPRGSKPRAARHPEHSA